MFDESDFQTIIQEADIDNDGLISYDEFIKLMVREIEQWLSSFNFTQSALPRA